MQEEFRKLATVRRIAEVRPIEGADLIEAVRVDGWWVVCKKDEYSVGSLAVYVEIDSWVPTKIAPFLSKGKEPKEYEGILGERLRTVKLRGQLSQGLLLPVNVIDSDVSEDADVTEILGITKWEPPAEFRAANAKGNFPFFIRKTDQERLQNIKGQHLESFVGSLLQKTEKLDGSSLTMFSKDGCIGVCSRNLELIRDEENTFWKTAINNGVDNLSEFCKGLEIDIAIQGEMIGPNIQGNKYNLRDHEFYCYDIFDITNQKYLNPREYIAVLDVEIEQSDYNGPDGDIIPGADPTAVSQTEKLLKAQGLMEMLPLGILDPVKVGLRLLEAQEQPNYMELLNQQVAQTGQMPPPPPDPKLLEIQAKQEAMQQGSALKQQEAEFKAMLAASSEQTKQAMAKQAQDQDLRFKAIQAQIEVAKALHTTRAQVAADKLKFVQGTMHKEVDHRQKVQHESEMAKVKQRQAAAKPKGPKK